MKHLSVLAVGLALLLSACSSSDKGEPRGSSDYGTGINTVDRQYEKPADRVWDATVAAIRSYDLRVDSTIHDDLGGEVVARRADGHQISAQVTGLDKNSSRISLRVEPGNRDLAQMLHERIAEKLGAGDSRAAASAGRGVEGTYDCDFASALAAADRSARAMNATGIQQQLHDSWAQLDARAEDSTPMRFRMTHPDDRVDATRVSFIGGSGKGGAGRTLAAEMKSEFDRQIKAGVQ